MGTDLIRIKHTELTGYVSSDLEYSGRPDIYVRNYDGEFQEENFSAKSIWEIEVNSIEERGEQFSMHKRNEDDFNVHKYSEAFRLRHFVSGKLFNNDPDGSCYLAPFQSNARELPNYSLISAEPILKHLNCLQKDYSYYFQIERGYLQDLKEEILDRDNPYLLEKMA